MKNRQAELDSDPTSFDSVGLRSVAAMALRSGIVPWKDMIGLAGHTFPSAKEDPGFRGKAADRHVFLHRAFKSCPLPDRQVVMAAHRNIASSDASLSTELTSVLILLSLTPSGRFPPSSWP